MNDINLASLNELISRALEEDLGAGDITTRSVVPRALKATGEFVAKEDMVLAGWPIVVRTFQWMSAETNADCSFNEGDEVSRGSVLGKISGPASILLSGERVALNFLQRLSGIATLTRKFVSAVSGFKTSILDTRKTTPGLRLIEKYAVRVGGGMNHRFGLSDGVLIKENHIAAAGSLSDAVRRAQSGVDHLKKIEVEVTNLGELAEALKAKADIILLDNMSVEEIKKSVAMAGGKVPLEVSGGVTLENVCEFAATGVDYISIGALTHSCKAVDISLELKM